MAEIMGNATTITLQINTSGAWKNMLTFEPARRAEVMRALKVFAGVLGASTRWCLLHPDGKREWLADGIGPWTEVAVTAPTLLEDVMVSVFAPGDAESTVFMAYRKRDGEYYISGTCDQRVRSVYAWAPVMDGAAVPVAAREVAA